MNRRSTLGLCLVLFLASAAVAIADGYAVPIPPMKKAGQLAALRMPMPVSFIENRGQVPDTGIRYVVQGHQGNLCFSGESIVFHCAIDGPPMQALARTGRGKVVRFTMTLTGAHTTKPLASNKLPGIVSYFLGKSVVSNVPTFAKLTYPSVYPGTDMILSGSDGVLKTEFVLAPGANAASIQVHFEEIEGIKISPSGRLLIHTPAGVLEDRAPVAHQQVGDRQRLIPVSYRLIDPRTYGFSVDPAYDHTIPLVIDPDMAWSTYLGGTLADYARDVAVDSSGSVYVTGETSSTNFPTAGSPYDSNHNGLDDVFVSKFSSDGSTLVYSTYLGGDETDIAYGIAVDQSGRAHLTGLSQGGFPVGTSIQGGSVFDPNHNTWDNNEGFITILDPNGTSLYYSTYTNSSPGCYDIALDGNGDIYVVGMQSGARLGDTPIPNGIYDSTYNGSHDAFLLGISPDGNGWDDQLYWTYLGGNELDRAWGVALYDGLAYVVGETYGGTTAFPTWPADAPFDSSFNGEHDAFLSVIRPVANDGDANDLVYSTFIGGSGVDCARDVAVDSDGDAIVVGEAGSGFPVSSGAFDESYNGAQDGFVFKLGPDGNGSSDRVYASYLGGSEYDIVEAVALLNDVPYLGGTSNGTETGFPTTPNAFQQQPGNQSSNAFISALSLDGSGLFYSTFVSGIAGSKVYGLAVDSCGNALACGTAGSGWTHTNPYQGTAGSATDAFVLKLGVGKEPTEWTGATGAWGDPNNWSRGVPDAYTDAYITNGGTAQVSSGSESARNVYLGEAPTGSGSIEKTGGTLSVASICVKGSGRIRVEGDNTVNAVNYDQDANGELEVEIGYGFVYGVVDCSASAAITDGTIDIQCLVRPHNGDTFTILQTDDGATLESESVTITTNMTPGNGGFTAAVVNGGKDIQVTFTGYTGGDATMNGKVDGLDYLRIQANWGTGTTWAQGDFNADGTVDGLDMLIWEANFPWP